MLDKKRAELMGAVGKMENINLQKETAIAIIEKRRKEDEEKYLKPVLEKETVCKQELEQKKKELIDAFLDQLEGFESVRFTEEIMSDVDEFLDLFVYLASLEKTLPDDIKKKVQIIYEYYLEMGEIDKAVTFLKTRSGSFFREDEISKKRNDYIRYLAENPNPEVETNAKYIMCYGEYREDIIKLFELCGRYDKKLAPKDFEGIYYSEKTALLIAMGALGEFGELAKHLYYIPPFGNQDCDRETLVYWHDHAYKEEGKKSEKPESEQGLE